jgi:hypothetical protein
MSFVHATGHCQRSLCRVRVPWDSRSYFTVSFETSLFVASTCFSCRPYNPVARTEHKTPFPTGTLLLHAYPLPRERIYRTVAFNGSTRYNMVSYRGIFLF